MQESVSSRIFVCKEGMICIFPTDICTETFGERWKGEKSPVVSLLPGSHEHLASRNLCILCQKYGGACMTYQLGVPKVQETGREIGFPRSQERHEENSE
jgi:hypothetical protein